MSRTSSCDTFESEDESSGWLLTSETSLDDGLSDELTLLNGDEDCDENTLSFEALLKLSTRLKKQYNLREATVELERCDKIWKTMQLVKKIQMNYESELTQTGEKDGAEPDADPKPNVELDAEPEDDRASSAGSQQPEGSFSSIPYIKYQPVQGVGNNALPNFYLAVKSQKKLYNCVTCGKQYSEKRSLAFHSKKEHGVVAPKPQKQRQSGRRRSSDNKSSILQDSVEAKISTGSSNRDGDVTKSRSSRTTKYGTENLTEGKKEPETKSSTEKINETLFNCMYCKSSHRYQRGLTRHIMVDHHMTLAEVRATYREDPSKSNLLCTESSMGKNYYYIFTCKTCGRKYRKKKLLLKHMRDAHKISVPNRRVPRRNKFEMLRDYESFTCEIVRFGTYKVGHVHGTRNDDERARKTRNVRRLIARSTNVDRPRRACASNTSYRECTKEEEEMLQKALTYGGATSAESSKSTNEQKTSPCFLCKKSFVDIKRHLIDYHRINCPETIIPLASKTMEIQKPENVESTEILEIRSNVESEKNSRQRKNQKFQELKIKSHTEKSMPQRKIKKYKDKSEGLKKYGFTVKTGEQQRLELFEKKCKELENHPYIRVVRKNKVTRGSRTDFQCTGCHHMFNRLGNLRTHLASHTIKGVLRRHPAPQPGVSSKTVRKLIELYYTQDPAVDPLSLTDVADSTTNEDSEKSDNAPKTRLIGEKRNLSLSNERLNSDDDNRAKRRKIDETSEFCNVEVETTMENLNNNYNNEMENPLTTSDTDCGSNEEDKSGNCRDTRDSSDRDSGIGISITIKKRNNSYEVVDKDICDDDKSKDSENSKDENTSSDSSTNATPVDFVMNEDVGTHGREIVDCGREIVDCESEIVDCGSEVLDYNAEKGIDETVAGNYENDETFREKSGDENCSRVEEETNFRWKEADCYKRDDCTNLSGLVRPEAT